MFWSFGGEWGGRVEMVSANVQNLKNGLSFINVTNLEDLF
jgi:hypothetical protein